MDDLMGFYIDLWCFTLWYQLYFYWAMFNSKLLNYQRVTEMGVVQDDVSCYQYVYQEYKGIISKSK